MPSPMERQARLWQRSTRELEPQATMEEVRHHISYLHKLESAMRHRAQILQKLYLQTQTEANELSTQRLRLEQMFVPITVVKPKHKGVKPKPKSLLELIQGQGLTPEAAIALLEDLAEREVE